MSIFKINDIELLLHRLSEKTGESLDHYGLGQISLKMDGSISQRYLYDSLVRPVENAPKNGTEELNLVPDKIDKIAKFLGFSNFNSFLKPIDPILKTCKGEYYSYLRRSTEKGMVFRSPVNIIEENGRIWLTMIGPIRGFKGELRLINDCLVCLLQDKTEDKEFHHVYQLGKREQPGVLLGVFSGMTTSGSPIGGRSLLIKQSDAFEQLEVNEMSITDMTISKEITDRRVAEYFSEFYTNNLQTPKPITYTIDDLGNCD